MANINGTTGSEKIAGTSSADRILAAGGNDTVNSGGGADWVFTGSGNDKIESGTGDDLVYGGAGNDTIGGGDGNDIVIGGSGNDALSGGAGDDILSGGSGNDVFQYSSTPGGFGNDTITDFGPGDKINLFAGSVGNASNISITSVAQLVALTQGPTPLATVEDLGNGAVRLTFGSFGSITFPNLGPDFGFAAASGNTAGTSGDDELIGINSVVGGPGDDVALVGDTSGQVQGGADNDTLIGGSDADVIGGQGGNDVLFGNGGDDQLAGGTGDDILAGGDGADTFLFSGTINADTIVDLDFTEGDVLSFVGVSAFGNNVRIETLAELQDLIDANNLTVTTVAGVSTIDLGGGDTLTLAGYNQTDLVV